MLRGQLELTLDLRKSFFSNGDDSSKARKNEKLDINNGSFCDSHK